MVVQREGHFAAQTLHPLPAAQHSAYHMQPLLQNGGGTGNGNKECGGNGNQQTGGQNLYAHADAVEQTRKHGDADAGQQAQAAVNGLYQLRAGGAVIGFHKIFHFALGAQQTVLALEVIADPNQTMQTHSLAHGVHLRKLRIALLQSRPQGHGHFQTEGSAAGNPQLHQAESAVHHTGGEGQCQQCVQGEAALQQIAYAVHHQRTAEQGREHHAKHLAENHQPQPVFRDHIQHKQGGHAGAQGHQQYVNQQGNLQLGGAHFRQSVVPLFRAGNQLLFQLLQPGAGSEHDGGGDEGFLHLEGRLSRSGSGLFLR